MNVQPITMPPAEARDRLKHYRKALHRRADAEYQEVAIGLEELAKGTPLITLADAFRDVPCDAKGRPMLAVARADRLRVRYSRSGSSESFNSDYEYRRGGPMRDGTVLVATDRPYSGASGYALVPITPPEARGTRDLSRHFILWEVERWADTAREVGPDRDPMLLRRLSVDLWAVVAQWDLTALEQVVLAGRRAR